jgi:hypothetical protein
MKKRFEIMHCTFIQAHHGILLASKRIKEVLDKQGILSNAFSLHPDYDLLFVGKYEIF